jgi:hypothetical protein
MRLYHLSDWFIAECINRPDSKQTDEYGKQIAWKRDGPLFVKVVYSEEGDNIVVITAGPRSRLPEDLS